jgi:hypothetical protein
MHARIMSQPPRDKRENDVANAIGDNLPDVAFDALGNAGARGKADENAACEVAPDAGDGEGLLDGIGESLADAADVVADTAGVAADAVGAVFGHLLDGL